MTRPYSWKFRTRHGQWAIVQRGEKWCPMFEDENLGYYGSPQQALDDLVGGHTDWPSDIDPSACGLPDDLSDWDRH